jgi:hypothetical protein
MSESFGVGVSYSSRYTPNQLGATLVLNREDIGSPVEPVQYTRSYFNNNPIVAAHAAWVGDRKGALHNANTGNLIGIYEGTEEGNRLIEWGEDVYDTLLTSEVTGEKEWVSHAPEVDISGAIDSIVSYYGTGVSGTSARTVLAQHPGFTRHGRRDTVATDDMEQFYLMRALHDMGRRKMVNQPAPYYVVLVDSMNDIGNDTKELHKDQFVGAYTDDQELSYNKLPSGVIGK